MRGDNMIEVEMRRVGIMDGYVGHKTRKMESD